MKVYVNIVNKIALLLAVFNVNFNREFISIMIVF